MDPFFFFIAFTVLTPASNHYAVMYHNASNPDLSEINISLNNRESKARAKYMAKLLSKMGAKEGTSAAGNWLLDDMLRYDSTDADQDKKG